jgi:hypothetical protein
VAATPSNASLGSKVRIARHISPRAFATVSLFHSGSTPLFITFRCSFEHSCLQDSLGTRSTQHFHYKVAACSV